MNRYIISILILFCCVMTVAAQPLPPPGTRADDGSTIDVLVIYTQNARAIAGGTHPQTITLINNAINDVNATLTSNGVLTQLNVVHYQPVFYLEQVNVDFHADLANLTGTGDGYLDDIHALRDYYAADLVLMVAGTWFYIYTGDSAHTIVPDAAAGFAIWEARGMDDGGGVYNVKWIARTLGVDDVPPYDVGQVATMNANSAAVANYRDSADRVIVPVELLYNGGFEFDMDADAVPDFWVASGWAKGDARACKKPANVNSGLCSLKFTIGSSTGNRVSQPVDVSSIHLNDEVTLNGFMRSKGAGTCIKVVLVVKYATQGKQKPKQTVCSPSPKTWHMFNAVFTTNDIVTGMTLRVTAISGGKVWLDDLSLSAAPANTRGGSR